MSALQSTSSAPSLRSPGTPTRQFSDFNDCRRSEDVAQRLWPRDDVTPLLLTRATTSPATTTTTGWAAELARNAVGDFIDSLAPQSAAARLINAGLQTSLAGINSIHIPRRQGIPANDVAWAGEGAPIPARAFNLTTTELGSVHKLAAICPMSRETVEFTSGEAVVSTLLREDMAASLDASMFSTAAASSVRPAGLLNGLTPIAATTGGGEPAIRADFKALSSAVMGAGSSENLVYIMSPGQALSARMWRVITESLTIWGTPAVPDGTVIAIEPLAFVSGFGPDPDLAVSMEATVHMDTTPAQIGTAGTPNIVAAPTVSAFQSDLILLRAILDCAWVMRAPLVAYLTGATW